MSKSHTVSCDMNRGVHNALNNVLIVVLQTNQIQTARGCLVRWYDGRVFLQGCVFATYFKLWLDGWLLLLFVEAGAMLVGCSLKLLTAALLSVL